MCWRWQQLDELPTKVRGLFSQNAQEQYEATQWFRKLLSIGEMTCRVAGVCISRMDSTHCSIKGVLHNAEIWHCPGLIRQST